jgi:aspartate aminotransferase
MAAVASETFTATSAPIQYAAVSAFLGGPELEEYLAACRRILKALGARVREILEQAGVVVPEAHGAFYLFPDFSLHAERLAQRGIQTTGELCERLLEETGVAMLAGTDFGRAPGELLARLAYVDFDGGAALAGVAGQEPDAPIDEAFLRRYCGRVLEAAERIAGWLPK